MSQSPPTLTRRALASSAAATALAPAQDRQPISIGSRRELMADRELVASMRGVHLQLATPVDSGVALALDKPWEGRFSAYTTILNDNGRFRAYYRGVPVSGQDGNNNEVTCCAESADGISWTRPALDLHEVQGANPNNVILAGSAPYSHNFSPFFDHRPGVPSSERYKALAGVHKTGLRAFVSEDGLRWRALRPVPVFGPLKEFSLDSQNIAFWSDSEQSYVLYFRTWKKFGKDSFRWVSRATSPDFLNWSAPEEISFGDAPPEHLYTNQLSPYFRAPHIYTGICARFMPGRQVLTEEQAAALGADPKYFKDCSDAVFITSRGGPRCHREFMEAFLRPGVGLENWVSRSNYPALNIVQTGPAAMSFYANRNYGQPTAHLRRYELRLDGFGSAHAGYQGGELLTKPLLFDGVRLELNFSTSAAGSIRVELQDPAGQPLTGFSLQDSRELIGDEIARAHTWNNGPTLATLRNKPIRLRFALKDADLYAFRFAA